MTHYVLLRLAPDSDKDAAERRVRKTYQELDETLSFLHNPRVYRSCVERDSNADIMAVIDLDEPEKLQDYLTHPLHVQMAQDMEGVRLVVEVYDPDVAFQVLSRQTPFPGDSQKLLQSGGRAGTEGHTGSGLPQSAFNAYQPGDRLSQRGFPAVKPGLKLFLCRHEEASFFSLLSLISSRYL